MTGKLFYAITLGFLITSGVAPHDRFTWWLEVSWVIAGLVLVPVLHRLRTRSSEKENLTEAPGAGPRPWITMSLQWALFLHAIILIYGGWHTYELVPLGEWLQATFELERNPYDRIGHVAQGVFPAILVREVLVRRRATRGLFFTELFVFSACMAFTGIFEILEYLAAVAFGDASNAYLGSQGDVWDAQNDMLCCFFGTITSQLVWGPWHRRELGG